MFGGRLICRYRRNTRSRNAPQAKTPSRWRTKPAMITLVAALRAGSRRNNGLARSRSSTRKPGMMSTATTTNTYACVCVCGRVLSLPFPPIHQSAIQSRPTCPSIQLGRSICPALPYSVLAHSGEQKTMPLREREALLKTPTTTTEESNPATSSSSPSSHDAYSILVVSPASLARPHLRV